MKKSRKRQPGAVLILAGAALIILSLALFIRNRREDARAGEASKNLLAELQSVMPDEHDAVRKPKPVVISSGPCAEEPDEATDEMPAAEIGGYSCIGVLSIPALGLKLPVISEWDYHRLTIAPCRQFGSTKTDDLVIAAHNYTNHFGNLPSLKAGDEVFFTALDGTVNAYEVVLTDTLAATAVDTVKDSGHGLVLYTCTYSGKTRVTVFCDRKM